MTISVKILNHCPFQSVELHIGALCGSPRNIVTALTTTMADVSAGKTANTHMYAKSVAGVILRDCADNHIKERVNQSLTTDQRTTMSPIKNAFRIPTMGSVLF